MADPVLIPIKQNVEDRTDTWKGYIRVEKAERHYFLIDGDDVMTLQWRESSMEADTKGAEIRTSALVMLNRPGSTKGNAYRNPLLSILTEFGEIKDGKNPDWASVINQQYAKVEVDEYMDIDRLSCEKLEEARKALLEVLSGGVTVPYDEFRTAVTTPTPHVTIGGTDFLTEKQYRNCIVKPDGCDSLSVWPGGPLDR